jgi:ABC-type polysaccharide/polyol phosphate transport system ATPase subunit
MNHSVVIEANNLWKKYKFHSENITLKKKIIDFLTGKNKKEVSNEVWVLQGIDFCINHREMVGIIGSNGVGKTTLLKLISGIIKPTKGEVNVHGSVTTLLELGAGFHPELTGRENIFLNGAILGMRRKQIENVINDIIDFSELYHFIDLPVKFYSSGMYMRLAFSIAAFVNTDIILIDEVIAVGDESFQRKCFRKINEMKQKGKTIIFVSHNLNAIAELCNRVIWLKDGKIQKDGKPEEVIEAYLNLINDEDEVRLRSSIRYRWGNREIEIIEVKLYNEIGEETLTFFSGEKICVRLKYRSYKKVEKPVFGIAIHRDDGVHIFGTNNKINNFEISVIDSKEEGFIECIIDQNLNEGHYLLSVSIYDYDLKYPYDNHNRLYSFKVIRNATQPPIHGPVYFPCEWRFIK